MLRANNLAQFNEGLDRWLEAVEDLANDAFRGLCIDAFSYILQGTPEWSGNLAASWRLNVGQPAVGYDPTVFKDQSFNVAGDREPFSNKDPNTAALGYAAAIARTQLPFIRLGAPVFISNPAPYAMEVEVNVNAKGVPFLRLVNQPYEMVFAAEQKFGSLGRISEVEAMNLARRTL